MNNKHLIFVYGTLKRGWGNNIILHDQRFIQECHTFESKYEMYSLGGFPGVVRGNKRIYGELWEVDDAALKRCDTLEGHPDFYQRELIRVYSEENSWTDALEAWIYIYKGNVDNCQQIGEWL
jgi:gamma-glutamylcyclotransferase (GGCT)/AIG2-like uncharacterized protein YtfP